ncbi:MAG: hypothetical protein LBS24_05300 [Clostridiales Family XIII bacterium]|nr:hypothetical protein [Clostridiales Family XIII bacterium]
MPAEAKLRGKKATFTSFTSPLTAFASLSCFTLRLKPRKTGNVRFAHFSALPKRKKKGVLYIEVDGAALNTRNKDEIGSSWRENKLGIVFSSDNIYTWINRRTGEKQRQILKREYVSYVGGVQEFKKHLLSCALKNGYGEYEKTVMISDGAAWIRNMREELFPDARQILDFYHLCENVNTFAKHAFGLPAKYTLNISG